MAELSSDALDGFEFLAMAEAGEVGHWNVLQTLGRSAQHKQVNDLVRWALPLQRNHLKAALDGSIALAAKEDPHSAE